MLLSTKVSKSHFNFVYGDTGSGKVNFGQIPRNSRLSDVPLFKRVPEECLLYQLKDETVLPHPKHIPQYLTYLASLQPVAVDFTCFELSNLFTQFQECITDEELVEELIGALQVDDFGYSSAELNLLRVLTFCLCAEENREVFLQHSEIFEQLIEQLVLQYRARLVDLAASRGTPKFEQEYWTFARFEELNAEKLRLLLRICENLEIFDADIIALTQRERLEPFLLDAALDFMVERAFIENLDEPHCEWLFGVLANGSLDSRLLACKALLNHHRRAPLEVGAHEKDFLALGACVRDEIMDFLQVKDSLTMHDYVYALNDGEQAHLYVLIKDMEVIACACYSLRLSLSCAAVMDVVVVSQQITQNMAIYLLSRRSELKQYANAARFVQILKRFCARIKNEYFSALLHEFTQDPEGVGIEFCWPKFTDAEMQNKADQLLAFVEANYTRDDDISTVCIDIALRIASQTPLISEISNYWRVEETRLGSFNRKRLNLTATDTKSPESQDGHETPDVLAGDADFAVNNFVDHQLGAE